MAEYESRLMEDIKTVDEFGSGLAVRESDSLLPLINGLDEEDVAAIEQGRRHRPDGTVEHYQRVEFREEV